MADNKNLPIEERSFRRSYLVFAALLAATTLWAAVDETFIRRPWKDYQAQFNAQEEAMVKDMIVAAEQALAAEDAQMAANNPQATQAGLQARIKELKAILETDEFVSRANRLGDIEAELFELERDYQFTKAIYDEVYYEWKEEQYHGEDFAAGKAEWEELAAHMQELQPVIDSVTQLRDQFKSDVEAARSDLSATEAELTARRQTIIDLERRLDNIQMRTIEIKQFVMRDFELNEWNQPIMRVDRCETCHMGINRAGFEDWPQPYTTHPKRTDIFGKHNPEQFGCTPCHDGQGPGLTVHDAHEGQHLWEFPMLAGADIDMGCQKCHFSRVELGQFMSEEQIEDAELEPQDVPYHPTKLIRGQKMVRDGQCYACHEIAGYEEMPKKGPQLNALSAKTSPEWTYDWLKNPWRFRPTTKMPNFLLPDSEAVAITAFLYRLSESSDWSPMHGERPRGNAARGGRNMAEFGCYGCHPTEGMYQEGDPALELIAEQREQNRWIHGPDLTRVGSKLDPVWLYNWLKNPQHYWPDSRMPSLRLTDREAGDIAEFLLSHGDHVSERAKLPAGTSLTDDALVENGEYWVRTYGCYGCHDIAGFEGAGKVSVSLSEFGAKKVDELFFGDSVTTMDHTWEAWTEGKMMFSRRYATELVIQRMPNYAFSPGEADSIALVLRSWDGRSVLEDYSDPVNTWMQHRRKGRLTSEYYNCAGCHILEGQRGDIRAVIGNPGLAPPNLNTEGRKVQSNWLYRFLTNPFTVRPWLAVRMPTFGFSDDHKTAVVDYFHALEEYEASYDYIDVAEYDPASVREGKRLFETYRCLSCHVLEDRSFTPEEMANLAPNLKLSFGRLRPDWVVDWLRDPQVIDPGTRMPSYFYSEGERLYEDADAQMDALRDYLMTIGAPKP